MTVDPRSDRAIYRQVADVLRARIADGTLAPGSMLPSEKQLADEYGVGRDAIRQALTVLRIEGSVRTQKGRGTKVRQVPDREQVPLQFGERAIARMPTEDERLQLDLDEGVPVVVVTRGDRSVEVLAGDVVVLVADGMGEPSRP